MIIDWFTVIAQIINFLILVALLKYFLFTPIVAAMRERKMKIETDMGEAMKREEQARNELEMYREKNRELEAMKNELLQTAREEARKLGDEYLLQVRKEAEAEHKRFHDALERSKREIAEKLRLLSLHDATVIVSHALTELTSVSIEKGLVDAFIRQLGSTHAERRTAIEEAILKAGKPLVVKSSFALGSDLQARLSDAVRKELSGKAEISYEHAPEEALSIEMNIDGYRLRWGIEQFLEDMEDEVAKAITDTFGMREEKYA